MKFLTLFFFLLPLSLFAENSNWFVGLEGGTSGAKFSDSVENTEFEYATQYGLKIGLSEDNTRIYLGYNDTDKISNALTSSRNVYIALEGVSNEFKVIAASTAKFFFGFHLGGSSIDANGDIVNGAMGGLQGGLDFMLPADFEIELAYRQYWTYKEKITNISSGTLYGGLNYKFYSF